MSIQPGVGVARGPDAAGCAKLYRSKIPEALWIETPMRNGLIFTAMLATLI
jgi:hypothetical protein